jgi:hypothetical protein
VWGLWLRVSAGSCGGLGPRDAVCGEEVYEFGLGGLEAEGAQRHAQLVVVEVAVAVEVEEGELFGTNVVRQLFMRHIGLEVRLQELGGRAGAGQETQISQNVQLRRSPLFAPRLVHSMRWALFLVVIVVVVVVDAAAAAVVVGRGRAVEGLVANMAGSVDLVCELGMTIRMAVGCCSVLLDRAVCSLGRMCCAGEMRTWKPLLALAGKVTRKFPGHFGRLNTSGRMRIYDLRIRCVIGGIVVNGIELYTTWSTRLDMKSWRKTSYEIDNLGEDIRDIH